MVTPCLFYPTFGLFTLRLSKEFTDIIKSEIKNLKNSWCFPISFRSILLVSFSEVLSGAIGEYLAVRQRTEMQVLLKLLLDIQ